MMRVDIIWRYNGFEAYRTDVYRGKMFSSSGASGCYIVVREADRFSDAILKPLMHTQHLILKCVAYCCDGGELGIREGLFNGDLTPAIVGMYIGSAVDSYLRIKGAATVGDWMSPLLVRILHGTDVSFLNGIVENDFGTLLDEIDIQEIVSAALQSYDTVMIGRRIRIEDGVLLYDSCVPDELAWLAGKASGLLKRVGWHGIFDMYPVAIDGVFRGYCHDKLMLDAGIIAGEYYLPALNCINSSHIVKFRADMLFDGQSDEFKRNFAVEVMMGGSELIGTFFTYFLGNPLFSMEDAGVSMSMAVIGCMAEVIWISGTERRILRVACTALKDLKEIGFVIDRDMFQKAVLFRILNNLMLSVEDCAGVPNMVWGWCGNGRSVICTVEV